MAVVLMMVLSLLLCFVVDANIFAVVAFGGCDSGVVVFLLLLL